MWAGLRAAAPLNDEEFRQAGLARPARASRVSEDAIPLKVRLHLRDRRREGDDHCIRLEGPEERVKPPKPRRDRAVQLAYDTSTAVSSHDAPRRHDVRSEIHRTSDSALRADPISDDPFVQTILHGYHEALRMQKRSQVIQGTRSVMSLHAQKNGSEHTVHLLREETRAVNGELIDRTRDA